MAGPANKWIIAATVMIPTLMVIVDTSVVNVSLDHIRGSLSAGIEETTWSITSYLAANAVIIPMTGWMSRLFGRKRYLLFSILLFTLSSLLCGLAWNIESLIFFRVLQGIGGGSMQPISQSILLETFPPEEHGMANAVFGVGIMFGPIIGPLLGGWITDNWSWHWIFFVNIPIGIISFLACLITVTDPPYLRKTGIRIDWWGLLLLAVGVGCLQMVLDQGQGKDWFGSALITWLAVTAAIALVFFIARELFSEQPIVNLRVFRNYSFTLGTVVLFFVLINLFGNIILPPIYVQTLMGYTATLAGLVIMPGGIASLLFMPIAGKLIGKTNPKFLIIFGLLMTALAAFITSQFSLMVDFWTIVEPRIVFGIGMAFIFIPLMTLSLSGIPKEEMGNATSIFNLVRNLGSSFGIAFVTTLLSRRSQFHHFRLTDHMTVFDLPYSWTTHQATQGLLYRGFHESIADRGVAGLIYEQLNRQAGMLAFNDVYRVLAVLLVLIIILVIFMRLPDHLNNRT
ncbi:MAG: DHA2 family efflux MFS transporter permease subunit [Deltaproteobacteria bacterium]|nr:DHA2 family efflux MFS transporter permease subunit [Deltaproteobacteria bacterium]